MLGFAASVTVEKRRIVACDWFSYGFCHILEIRLDDGRYNRCPGVIQPTNSHVWHWRVRNVFERGFISRRLDTRDVDRYVYINVFWGRGTGSGW